MLKRSISGPASKLGTIGLLLFCAPAAAAAAPHGAEGIGPVATKEVRIIASVRPTMLVMRSAGEPRPTADPNGFCIWSNTPSRRFDVRLGYSSDEPTSASGPDRIQFRWGASDPSTVGDGQSILIKDQAAGKDASTCLSNVAYFKANAQRDESAAGRTAGVVTLMISPQ